MENRRANDGNIKSEVSYFKGFVVISSLLLVCLLLAPSAAVGSPVHDEAADDIANRQRNVPYDRVDADRDLSEQSVPHDYDPPDDPIYPDPVIPDPGNLSRRIGSFGEDKEGSFVSFDVLDDGIKDHIHHRYTEEGVNLFKSIRVEDLTIYEKTPRDYLYEIRGDRAHFRVYDKPSAVMTIDVRPQEGPEMEQHISFEIDDQNTDIIPMGANGLQIDYGEFTATLLPYGPMDGLREYVRGRTSYINFTVFEQTSFVFRVEEKRIYHDVDIFEMMNQGIESGRIGAEVRAETVNGHYKQMSVIYDRIALMSQMLDDRAFQMVVSSDTLGNDGKVIMADISSTLMDISEAEDLNVTFDGEPIDRVDSYSELTARSGEATYLLITGEESAKIFVNVPHFSTHTIIIEESVDITDEPTVGYIGDFMYYLPGIVISAVVVILGAVLTKSKKSKEKEKGFEGKGRKNEEEEEKKVKGKKSADKKNTDGSEDGGFERIGKSSVVSVGSNPEKYDRSKGNEKRIKVSQSSKKSKEKGEKDND